MRKIILSLILLSGIVSVHGATYYMSGGPTDIYVDNDGGDGYTLPLSQNPLGYPESDTVQTGDTVIIESGAQVIAYSTSALTANYNLIVQSGATLTLFDGLNSIHSGSLTVENGGNLILNSGASLLVNYDAVFSQNNPSWSFSGALYLQHQETIQSGSAWTVNGGILNIHDLGKDQWMPAYSGGGEFHIDNWGTLNVTSGGRIEWNGTVINAGTINMFNNSTIEFGTEIPTAPYYSMGIGTGSMTNIGTLNFFNTSLLALGSTVEWNAYFDCTAIKAGTVTGVVTYGACPVVQLKKASRRARP